MILHMPPKKSYTCDESRVGRSGLSREGKTLAVEKTDKKLTEFSLNAGTGYCHRLGENGIYQILFLILYINAYLKARQMSVTLIWPSDFSFTCCPPSPRSHPSARRVCVFRKGGKVDRKANSCTEFTKPVKKSNVTCEGATILHNNRKR